MRSGPETFGPTIENTKNPTQHHLKAIWQRSTCLLNYLRINSHNSKSRTSLRLAGRYPQAEKPTAQTAHLFFLPSLNSNAQKIKELFFANAPKKYFEG